MEMIQLASHVCITLAAVVAVAIRLEHRLTRIETDVSWLKKNITPLCTEGREDERMAYKGDCAGGKRGVTGAEENVRGVAKRT